MAKSAPGLRRKIGGGLHKLALSIAGVNKAARTMSLDTLFLTGRELPIYSRGNVDAEAYAKSTIVYACVSKQARDLAGVPLKFLRDPLDDTKTVSPSDPIVKLFNQPHPALNLSEWMTFVVLMLQLRGEVFVLPDEPRRPTKLTPWYDPLFWRENIVGGSLAGWSYVRNAESFERIAADVMHHRHINPANPYRGLAPLAAAGEAYGIDTKGDALQRSQVEAGGERPVAYKTSDTLDDVQYQQKIAALRSRRRNTGEIGLDILLDGDLEIIDPKLTASDLNVLASQTMAADKICYAYGMSMALIGRDSAANYVDTFRRRQAIYWQETMLPLMRGIEAWFDDYFVEGPPRSGVFVRFDLSKVEALQREMGEQLDNAKKLRELGVPLKVINDHLNLGLPTEQIPGADQTLVPVGYAPYSLVLDEWSKPVDDRAAPTSDGKRAAEPPNPPAAGGRPVIDRKAMLKRATDPRTVIQRTRRMIALEKRAASVWRNEVGDVKAAALKIVRRLTSGQGATAASVAASLPGQLMALRQDTKKSLPDKFEPIHTRAAAEGVFSVQVLLERAAADDAETYLKAPPLSEAARRVVQERRRMIEDMADGLFDRLLEGVTAGIAEGTADVGEVARLVAHEMNVSANRAMTIGRTEVGTAYNASRFVEMGEQGFEYHEWLANDDDRVRDSHLEAQNAGAVRVGEKFPGVRLAYPMEPGGPAEEVINCRCETIPAERG